MNSMGLDDLVILIGGIIILYLLYRAILVRYKYGEAIEVEATVTDMDYVPGRTVNTYNAGTKSTTVSTIPAQHNVYMLDARGGRHHHNHEELYQTVRLDDEVTIKYQSEYKGLLGKDPSTYRPYGTRIISVKAPTGRLVSINDPKSVDTDIVMKDIR